MQIDRSIFIFFILKKTSYNECNHPTLVHLASLSKSDDNWESKKAGDPTHTTAVCNGYIAYLLLFVIENKDKLLKGINIYIHTHSLFFTFLEYVSILLYNSSNASYQSSALIFFVYKEMLKIAIKRKEMLRLYVTSSERFTSIKGVNTLANISNKAICISFNCFLLFGSK